jgi:branched-subunit amino acid ABC-type transport system permease component
MDLLLDAVVIGVLLGCFYAAVSLGLSVSFGLLDVPHVAHPGLSGAGILRGVLPQRALMGSIRC